jgi:hypothetical protein
MNDYIDNFTMYVLHVGIASELHQIKFFITGLQDPLWTAVAQHCPQVMETSIALA